MTEQEFVFAAENHDQMMDVAFAILENAGQGKVFALYGEMGSGKTTLIKAFCKILGVTSMVSSPTFSIVNEYVAADSSVIYHFDFYRIRDIKEAYDLGYENYFFSGNICFIEWPEKISTLLDFPHLKITIEVTDKKRIVTLRA